MKYSTDELVFDEISPLEFENLCYDLLVKYNFQNLIWRQGGSDFGRDIEGYFLFGNSLIHKKTKWFFECKHYTSKGIPVDELYSKVAWADAERPNFLVFILSSYLTNNARHWIEKIKETKPYDIIVVEREELKSRVIQYSDLIEQYFSVNKYAKLLSDAKKQKIQYRIQPSYEFLEVVLGGVDFAKLEPADISFILFSFYQQYSYFEQRENFIGDFDEGLTSALLESMKNLYDSERIHKVQQYDGNYDVLGSYGCFDEARYMDDEELGSEPNCKYQYYELHLNHNMDRDYWKVGYYLFIYLKNWGVEIFQDESTEIRVIRNFDRNTLNTLAIQESSIDFDAVYKYLSNIK